MTGARQPHVLLVVENVALARDHRLQKQVSSLHGHGYRVTVIAGAAAGAADLAGVGA
jgi:6-pyruvoyl-tetrahydropterin synthase